MSPRRPTRTTPARAQGAASLGLLIAFATLAVAGCNTPNKANIQLRKDVVQLQSQVRDLESKNRALAAQLEGAGSHTTTAPTLPLAKLDNLFTAHGLEIHRLTSGTDLQHSGNPYDTGLRIYLYPTDDGGNPIQATGHFTIDAFDLAVPDKAHVGHWEFTPQQAKKSWFGGLLRYSFIFEAPFDRPPQHPDLTLRVRFADELTGRVFTAERQVKVRIPASSVASTAPSARR